jgi:NAD-dependent oxidoreductase involved in siderophore biosynthesis
MMKFGEGHNSGERQTDLRGQAVLDALGLLDEVESAQFERAFRDAPPSVQADLRAVQAAVAVDPAFLADGEPAPDLRLTTLARVLTAVEQQEVMVVVPSGPVATCGASASRPSVERLMGSLKVVREMGSRFCGLARPAKARTVRRSCSYSTRPPRSVVSSPMGSTLRKASESPRPNTW